MTTEQLPAQSFSTVRTTAMLDLISLLSLGFFNLDTGLSFPLNGDGLLNCEEACSN